MTVEHSIHIQRSTLVTGVVVSPGFDVLFLSVIEPGNPIFRFAAFVGHRFTNTGTIEALYLTGNVFTASNQLGPLASKDASCEL